MEREGAASSMFASGVLQSKLASFLLQFNLNV